ncbi:MAG: FG-GAP-like repeat-containing protein [Actinomycetota bacterium]|nr:FG-GAP-like repeat-containing protein [Actinomycetota bacterium]
MAGLAGAAAAIVAATALPLWANVDTAFAGDGRYTNDLVQGFETAVRPNGNVVAIGYVNSTNVHIYELNAAGSVVRDEPVSVGGLGAHTGLHTLGGLALQSDGTAVAAFGTHIGTALLRFNTSLQLSGVTLNDNCGTQPRGVATDSHDNILVVSFPGGEYGQCPGATVNKYSAAGTHISSWGDGTQTNVHGSIDLDGQHYDGHVFPSGIAIDSLNRIIIAGGNDDKQPGYTGVDQNAVGIARITAAGGRDSTFGSATGQDAGHIRLDAPGNPQATGGRDNFGMFPLPTDTAIGRFAQSHHSEQGMGVAVDAQNRIYVVGTQCTAATDDIPPQCTAGFRGWVARVTAAGTLDTSFGNNGWVLLPNPGGAVQFATEVSVAPNGRVYVSGFTGTNPARLFVTALSTSGAPVTDFDGDGYWVAPFGDEKANESQQPLAISFRGSDSANFYVAGIRSSAGSPDGFVASFNASGTTAPPATTPPATTPPATPTMFASAAAAINGDYEPLAGDFNGDGRTDVFWYGEGSRPDGLTLARSSPRGLVAAPSAGVGGVYEPVVGDFNGDGFDDIFWYGPGTTPEYLWRGSNRPGTFTGQRIRDINGSYTPLAGQFYGTTNGPDDVFLYGPGATPEYLFVGTPNGAFAPRSGRGASGTYRTLVGDYDGNGYDDIYFWGPGSTPEGQWRGVASGAFVNGPRLGVGGDYLAMVGDFGGDGRDDIFWYAPGSGAEYLWTAAGGGAFRPGGAPAANGVYSPFTGDIDGNGKDDIFWYRPGPGTDYYWFAR